jgi:hypothetical protein
MTETEKLLNRKIDLRHTPMLSGSFQWGMNTYNSTLKDVPAHEAIVSALQMRHYAAELEAAACKIFEAVEDFGLSSELKFHQDTLDGKRLGVSQDIEARTRTSGRIVELKGHLKALAKGEYKPEEMY